MNPPEGEDAAPRAFRTTCIRDRWGPAGADRCAGRTSRAPAPVGGLRCADEAASVSGPQAGSGAPRRRAPVRLAGRALGSSSPTPAAACSTLDGVRGELRPLPGRRPLPGGARGRRASVPVMLRAGRLVVRLAPGRHRCAASCVSERCPRLCDTAGDGAGPMPARRAVAFPVRDPDGRLRLRPRQVAEGEEQARLEVDVHRLVTDMCRESSPRSSCAPRAAAASSARPGAAGRLKADLARGTAARPARRRPPARAAPAGS
jgi:hypothetical protein